MYLRRLFRIALCAGMLYSTVALSQEDKELLSVRQINPEFYILTQQFSYGEISVGLSVGNDGVLLIDGLPNEHKTALVKSVKSLSKKPVKFVLNSYTQESRTGANKPFQESGATVVSALDEYPTWLAADDKTADVVYSNQLNLNFNDEDISLKRFRVHTLGDSIIKLSKSNVIFTSFAYVSNRLPQSENFGRQLDAYNYILSIADDNTLIVPGSGKLSNRKTLESYRQTLLNIKNLSIKLFKTGKDVDAISADPEILKLTQQITTRLKSEREQFQINEKRVLRSIVSSIVLNHSLGRSSKLSDETLSPYTGRYQTTDEEFYDIILLDGMLRLGRMTSQYFTYEISPAKTDMFYIPRNGTRVSFSRNSFGELDGLTLDIAGELTQAKKIN